jgi:hypothetical protein
LIWTLYRYRRTYVPGSEYPIGPENRRHGFYPPTFFDEAVYPSLSESTAGFTSSKRIFRNSHQKLSETYTVQRLALPNEV